MLCILADEDILGLQVAMIDPRRVTCRQRVDDLQEEALDVRIVAAVVSAVLEEVEEVTARDVVQDEEDVVLLFDDLVQGHDVRVVGKLAVELDLLSLQDVAPGALGGSHDALDCVLGRTGARMDVLGEEDYTIGARTQRVDKLESTLVDGVTDKVRDMRAVAPREAIPQNGRKRRPIQMRCPACARKKEASTPIERGATGGPVIPVGSGSMRQA
ncbi:hypothetical protein NUW54_g6546 [Trametes sanguinea]|uniref:Uncharacterized protein n=1 Tax=Trametes sanguinea TaxID=158606 RepID=A0ACC1PSF4_9APHY|nr:hypothetical protein NUW54_g6546 [Trametes sanguinea]